MLLHGNLTLHGVEANVCRIEMMETLLRSNLTLHGVEGLDAK